MQRPIAIPSLRHVALQVRDIEACLRFYQAYLGMRIEWQPDPDNIYLTNGHDNLALHRIDADFSSTQRLDHIGFMLKKPSDVDEWYTYLKGCDVTIKTEIKEHRDGARSFYCADPDGNIVQMIYHPPLADVL